MKRGYTHLIGILDRSGSMLRRAADTVGGFDAFVAEQKAMPGQATMTLIQFDTEYEIVYSGLDIQAVPPLNFKPRGNTALLDALGKAIVSEGEWLASKPEEDRPENVICLVITDGQENASKEMTKAQVRELVTHQTDVYQWHFVFLGANMDAVSEGASLGISTANAATYDTAAIGSTYRVTSDKVKALRSNRVRGASAMAFTKDEREKLRKE